MENTLKELVKEFSQTAWNEYLPHLSIDCVVFGYNAATMKVLLVKLKDQELWSLPGGYIRKEEDIKEAANRILIDRTGAHDIYLQQFSVFADKNRSEEFFKDFEDGLWNKQRFISLGFYALADYEKVNPVIDIFSSTCEWIDINELPVMMMDHRTILDQALLKLRKELNYKPIGYNLLPDEFTMPELQRLYEIILDKKLNRGNFYRKMIGYDILDKMDEPRMEGKAHKAPNLYRFNIEKYKIALQDGLKEGW
ncbi:NUDIX hydrolase [Flavobacterium hercynium]|uniref:NUDIX hydrolase n=1 Tax=Flavobacterium hercynium TaxID=387094 RepID=A0A226H6Y8_9FLAO|nr:NUDIX domain-containing protein [Flavobacterium hercynium]OXA90079.1 NUDIX hydrolase [Flavobacterium hercynium]SMP14793.1 NUDIX domain-containing protein [Flavobacterium hercynium]